MAEKLSTLSPSTTSNNNNNNNNDALVDENYDGKVKNTKVTKDATKTSQSSTTKPSLPMESLPKPKTKGGDPEIDTDHSGAKKDESSGERESASQLMNAQIHPSPTGNGEQKNTPHGIGRPTTTPPAAVNQHQKTNRPVETTSATTTWTFMNSDEDNLDLTTLHVRPLVSQSMHPLKPAKAAQIDNVRPGNKFQIQMREGECAAGLYKADGDKQLAHEATSLDRQFIAVTKQPVNPCLQHDGVWDGCGCRISVHEETTGRFPTSGRLRGHVTGLGL